MKNWDQIKHFSPREFIRGGLDYSHVMTERFIRVLDAIREETGIHITVSGHALALGRFDHKWITSDHYLDSMDFSESKEVLEVADLMPYTLADYGHASVPITVNELKTLIDSARRHGINAIGVYPDWEPLPGVHFAIRELDPGKDWAKWAGVKSLVQYEGRNVVRQEYVALEVGMQRWKEKYG